MREIKFRAWSGHDWFTPEIVFGNAYFAELIERYNVINQYTGLKDRNGKEIYEGDIVATLSSRYSIVRYGEYSNASDQSKYILGFYLDHLHPEMQHFRKDIIFWVKDGIEIIGNIYENPELIKGQKS